MKLAETTWPDVAALDREQSLLLFPIAACEQHGRHLPTFTDSWLCGEVASRIEAAEPRRILMMPVLWLGASDHHLPLGATLSAGTRFHSELLERLLRPWLENGFRRVFVLNGHGGNTDTMKVALRELAQEFPDRILAGANYWDLAEKEWAALAAGPRKVMGHACEFETSMMLALRPDLVRKEKISDDPPNEAFPGVFLARDFATSTQHGAVGFPSFAEAERGKALLNAAAAGGIAAARQLLSAEPPERQSTDRSQGEG